MIAAFPDDEQLCNGLHSLSYVPRVAVMSNGYGSDNGNLRESAPTGLTSRWIGEHDAVILYC